MTESNTMHFPRVIGHRGAAGHAPENTLAGFRTAAALGATWVEFDVALTRDNIPVLLHDETLERTTDGTGKLAEKTYQELSGLDAGAWFGQAFAGEPIPRLDTTVALLDTLGLCANVEIKPTKGRARKTGEIVGRTIADKWPKSLRAPVFSSFTSEALAAARKTAPTIPRGFLMHRMRRDWREQAEALDCLSIHCNHRILNADRARQIRDAGYRLLAYTVNDAKRALQLTDWGVESVFSDFPDRILTI